METLPVIIVSEALLLRQFHQSLVLIRRQVCRRKYPEDRQCPVLVQDHSLLYMAARYLPQPTRIAGLHLVLIREFIMLERKARQIPRQREASQEEY